MEYLIGLLLAAAVVSLPALGIGRGRDFYPIVTIIVASYYLLFAATTQSGPVVLGEALAASAFVLAAVIGVRRNLWFIAIALVGHGLFDLVHHRLIDNPGVPPWWPGFCMSFDVMAGVVLAALLVKRGDSRHIAVNEG